MARGSGAPRGAPFHVLRGLAALTLGLLLASHAGGLWPPGDSLAVGRLHLGAAGLGLALLLRRRGGLVLGAVCLWSLAQTLWLWRPVDGGGPVAADLVLYQKNMLFRNPTPEALVAEIAASGADLVALQETDPALLPVLAALAPTYPHQVECHHGANIGVAILSRRPFVEGSLRCPRVFGYVEAAIDTPAGPLRIVSLHLPWPWPRDQARAVPVIAGLLAEKSGPVIVAGDLNMVPWGASVAAIEAAAGGARVGGYGTTFPGFSPLVPLPIDHVILPEGVRGQAERRPLVGSDHHGLLVRIDLP